MKTLIQERRIYIPQILMIPAQMMVGIVKNLRSLRNSEEYEEYEDSKDKFDDAHNQS
jgi:hypothetical protein